MLEQRHETRASMIRTARVVFAGSSLDCALLDLSESGARVILRAVADLPETLVLWVPDGKARMAHRIWQWEKQAGFRFAAVAPRWSAATHPASHAAPCWDPRP